MYMFTTQFSFFYAADRILYSSQQKQAKWFGRASLLLGHRASSHAFGEMGNFCGRCPIKNPLKSQNPFSAIEKRNISIYIAGIMLYKFALECFNASIVLLAADRFKAIGAFTAIGILSGLNQAFQCVGSIAIAPLIKRWPTRTVLSASIITFGVLSAIIMIVDRSMGGSFPVNGKSKYGK